ncbi:MAG: sulfite exporter TauE/SafE family protein [Sphingomonas bacterium]|nr:sulfite exporter TauE/SafE family protein [Sphingomonas bacterium]
MIVLVFGFFATALVYALAGFGGGSTYNALLVLAEVEFRAVPILALCCNIIVVAVGSWRFARAGHIEWRRIWPLIIFSVPLAWIGGRLDVAETLFVGLLALSLLVAGLLMLWQPSWQRGGDAPRRGRWLEPVAGGTLGFLAGVVGIGGGIFLAPLLYMLRWGSERAIAGTCALFILVNSIAGLAGQLSKDNARVGTVLADHWPLFPAVLVGGLIGSTLGSQRLDPRHVRLVTAVLVLYVAARLGLRLYDQTLGG